MKRDTEFFVEVFKRNDRQMFYYLTETHHRQKDSDLILVINKGHFQMAKLLIENDADLSLRDNYGNIALMIVSE